MVNTLPMVEGLRYENWLSASPEQRLEALKDMEKQLASLEAREPCQLDVIPQDILSEENNAQDLYGLHIREHLDQSGKLVPETIQINPRFLADGQPPYSAVETYFHEARHSYQDHVADHPDLAENVQQAEDFYKAKHGGYLDSDKVPHRLYRCQPTEIDANHKGQTNTAIIYDQFGELEGYLDHMKSPEYANNEAGFAIESYYKDEARERVDKQFELARSQEEIHESEEELQQLRDPDQVSEERGEEAESIQTAEEGDQSQDLKSGEDYDYGYGYGV